MRTRPTTTTASKADVRGPWTDVTVDLDTATDFDVDDGATAGTTSGAPAAATAPTTQPTQASTTASAAAPTTPLAAIEHNALTAASSSTRTVPERDVASRRPSVCRDDAAASQVVYSMLTELYSRHELALRLAGVAPKWPLGMTEDAVRYYEAEHDGILKELREPTPVASKPSAASQPTPAPSAAAAAVEDLSDPTHTVRWHAGDAASAHVAEAGELTSDATSSELRNLVPKLKLVLDALGFDVGASPIFDAMTDESLKPENLPERFQRLRDTVDSQLQAPPTSAAVKAWLANDVIMREGGVRQAIVDTVVAGGGATKLIQAAVDEVKNNDRVRECGKQLMSHLCSLELKAYGESLNKLIDDVHNMTPDRLTALEEKIKVKCQGLLSAAMSDWKQAVADETSQLDKRAADAVAAAVAAAAPLPPPPPAAAPSAAPSAASTIELADVLQRMAALEQRVETAEKEAHRANTRVELLKAGMTKMSDNNRALRAAVHNAFVQVRKLVDDLFDCIHNVRGHIDGTAVSEPEPESRVEARAFFAKAVHDVLADQIVAVPVGTDKAKPASEAARAAAAAAATTARGPSGAIPKVTRRAPAAKPNGHTSDSMTD